MTENAQAIQPVNLQEFIDITKNFHGMRISVHGVTSRIAVSRGNLSGSSRWGAEEIARIYALGKEAWLKGDLKEVAEMFACLD